MTLYGYLPFPYKIDPIGKKFSIEIGYENDKHNSKVWIKKIKLLNRDASLCHKNKNPYASGIDEIVINYNSVKVKSCGD